MQNGTAHDAMDDFSRVGKCLKMQDLNIRRNTRRNIRTILYHGALFVLYIYLFDNWHVEIGMT